nr:filamentous hemagglutinin N-terminal domain-containing protein [uncultured Massilia sp.]
MNKLRYRLVFNKTRGMCMAVGETARSQGKGAGQDAGRDVADGTVPAALRGPALRRMAWLLALGLGGWTLAGGAFAQVIADPRAPGQQRPTVLNAGNGVLQVNVQTPSAAGVSRNVYSQFDVPKSGVILNNARTDVQSQLGGWVQANPWMTHGTAKVILNEVNSSNPSRLQGYVEVAGDRAETVIANPAGIVVDGGGFINVSRATLTTGTPLLEDGRLTGYSVQRGQIVIDGAGLDAASTDYTALIARSVQVNAGLWAQRLNVVAGVNEVAEGGDTPSSQARPAADGAPLYAIDVARLGGMYANHIYLVGTETGVGVRNAGEIGAAAGDLVVTASGRLENTGTLSATGQLQAQAASIDNRGTVAAQRLDMAAASVRNDGGSIVQTGSSVLAVDATQVRNTGGTLGRDDAPAAAAPSSGAAQPVATTAPATGTGNVAAGTGTSADTAASSGNAAPAAAAVPAAAAPVLADGKLQTALLDNTNGLITANGGIAVGTARFDNHGGHAYLDRLSVSGPAFDNTAGVLTVVRSFTARTDSFVNDQGKLLVGAAFDAGSGSFSNRQGLVQAGRLAIDVREGLDNTGGILRQLGGGTATVAAGADFAMDRGLLDVAGGLDLRAGSISGSGSALNVTGDLSLHSGTTSAVQGKWLAGGSASLETGDFDNRKGIVSAAGKVDMRTEGLNNAGGTIAAGTDVAIAADGAVDNTRGIVQATRDLALQASGTLGNSAGDIETLGAHSRMDVSAAGIDNAGGRIANAGDGKTTVSARATVDNGGLIGGNGDVAIAARTVRNESGGRIVSVGDLDMAATGLLSNAGAIGAGGSFRMAQDGAQVVNRGTLVAARDIDLVSASVDNSGGTIATEAGGAGAIDLTTGSLANRSGTIQADGAAQLTVRGGVDNLLGQVRSGGDLALDAGGRIENGSGSIVSAGTMQVHGGEIGNQAGTISAAGIGDSRIEADRSIDNSGLIGANGSLAIDADILDNSTAGLINSGGRLELAVHDRLENRGTVSSAGHLVSDEKHATWMNTGTITAGGGAQMNLDRVENAGGTIAALAGADLALKANEVGNQGGRLMAGGDAALRVSGSVDNTGGIAQAGGSLDADIGAALVNAKGVVEALGAHGTLGVRAGSIDNTDGRIVNVGDGAAAVTAVGHIANSGLIAGNGQLTVGAATMDNSGTVSAGKHIELAVSSALTNSGTISAATGLHSEQADAVVRNSGTIVSGGTLAMTVKSIDNGGGRIATAQDSHADMLLSAQNIRNQGGAIMVDRDAAFLVKDGVDNRTGLVQAKGNMRLDAGGLVDTSAGSIETLSAASTLDLHAGALLNEAGRIVNAGSGDTAVRADTTLVNSGQIAGNGALALEAQAAVNRAEGTIAAGGALALQVHASLDNAGSIGSIGSRGALHMDEAQAAIVNRGSIVADADVAIRAGTIDNDKGTLATATGSVASMALQADSLTNRGGTIVAGRALALDVAGALDNSHGTLQGVETVRATAGGTLTNDGGVLEATGAAATLTVQANAIHNDGGRIVDVGIGATTVSAADSLMNSGLVAGNGSLALDAGNLSNTASGTIASGAAMTVAVGERMDNAGTVNSGATLDIAAHDAAVRNSGLVVAQGALALDSGAFDNDGGQFATAKGSGAGMRIDAASVSNRGGTILADRDVRLHSAGSIDNVRGMLQAGGALQVDAGGTLANDAGVIEALDPAATLALHAGAVDNGSGRIVNVGSGTMDVTVDGTLSSRGLVAGNGAVTMAVSALDNGAGASIAAGATLDIAAATSVANAGAISSHDTLTLAASGATVRNSGQIVSGSDATLDTGAFDNGGGQIVTVQGSGGAIVLRSASMANAGGAIVADGSAAVTVVGDADNRRGTLHAAGSLSFAAGGGVQNDAGTIEVTGSGATLDVQAASVDNGSGQLVNAGTGATHVTADGDIRNAGTLAGNGSVDLVASTIHNDAGGTIAAGSTLELHAGQSLDNAGKLSAAGTLTMDEAAARIANSGQVVAGGRILLHGASISNDGGQVATQSGADIAIDSEGVLSNRDGVVAAAGNATIDATGAYDNSQGKVQTQGRLQVTVGGALANNGGALEAVGSASTLALQAASLDNTAGRIVNAGGRTTVDSATSIVNSGTIAGNGALDIASLTLQNRSGGTIGAGGALELGVRQQFSNLGGTVSSGGTLHFDQAAASFSNSGRMGAGGTATITAATIANDGGQLYTVQQSGAAILLHGGSLSNIGGTAAADGLLLADSGGAIANNGGTLHGGTGADIDAGTTLDNGSGTIETAAGRLDIDARSISSSGRIVNAGSGATTLTSASGIVNGGTIAGNGTLDLHAATLQNLTGGQVASGGSLLVDVGQQWTNAGTVSSGGTLRFDQAGAAFVNSGQVASRGDAVFRAASFNNDGGKISTVDGSGADISVTAPALSNRGGAILADGDATFSFSSGADNSQGTLQAGAKLSLTTPGNIVNAGGTIEAVGTAGTLTLDGASIDNGNGRITNAGSGDTRLTSRGNIANNGTIAAMGNLALSAQTLQNGAAGTIASGRNMELAITQQLANQGKVNSGGTLTFNQAGATFTNSGQVFAGGNATITAKVVDNSGGQLGTGSGSSADLALTSEQLSNQGGRIATDRDLAVNTHTVTALGELFGGRDLALTMDGDYVQGAGGQQFHSNRDLSLTVTGNITNTSTFGAIGTLTLSGQQITNQAGASIEGNGVVLKAGGNLGNAGEINGAGKLDINAANVSNTGGIVGGNVTLATGNLDNTGGSALIGATGSLELGVSGTLNNTGNATLYSSGNMTIGAPGGAGTVNNISSTIEAGGNLALNASTLNNVRENIVIEHVKTVDETVHMSMPSWYKLGDNHESYETTAANYYPHEVYFVDPDDVIEDKLYVTPDGYTIHRAVIKTHANDSAFFVAGTGLNSA